MDKILRIIKNNKCPNIAYHFKKIVNLHTIKYFQFFDTEEIVVFLIDSDKKIIFSSGNNRIKTRCNIIEGLSISNIFENTELFDIAFENEEGQFFSSDIIIKSCDSIKGILFISLNFDSSKKLKNNLLLGFLFNHIDKRVFYETFFKAFYENIDKEIKFIKLATDLKMSERLINIISKSIDDGVICFDEKANILFINDSACKMLKIKKEDAVGKHVTEIVDFTPVILSVFKTHQGYIDREFRIESPTLGTMHFVKTAIVVKDENGNFSGVVDFFRRIDRVKKFVTNYIGAKAKFKFSDIIGKSEGIKSALRIAKIAAKSNSNVLIYGETGTGKEIFAQAIHYEGLRSKGPFVSINCGAIPRDLAESELFGYEPGSFTGASKYGRPGKFELADRGTIFLDEIGELPIPLQIKLLRVLQNKNIFRIGATKPIEVDIRIIAATNKDLYNEINQGNFRKDLFYRLNVIYIELPPLRERLDDLPLLIEHFIKKFSKSLNKTIKGYDNSFIKPLYKYYFPGNVRELENIIERAINITSNNILTEKELPEYIFTETSTVNYKIAYKKSLEEFKKELIIDIYKKTNGNISEISRVLKISRPTIYKILKELNIK